MTWTERIRMYAQQNPNIVFGILFVLLFTITSMLVTKPFYSKPDSLPILTSETFAETLDTSDKPVIIEFFAPWCGPCRIQGSILNDYQEKHADSVVVAKVNIDQSKELAEQYGINAIPTIIVFRQGAVTTSSSGIHESKQIDELLAK